MTEIMSIGNGNGHSNRCSISCQEEIGCLCGAFLSKQSVDILFLKAAGGIYDGNKTEMFDEVFVQNARCLILLE